MACIASKAGTARSIACIAGIACIRRCCAIQVWWFLGSISCGKIFVHDLASASTKELQAFQSGSAVACMQVDSQGYVWLGFKGGQIQVWDAQTRSCVCKLLSTSAADARCVSELTNCAYLIRDRSMLPQHGCFKLVLGSLVSAPGFYRHSICYH